MSNVRDIFMRNFSYYLQLSDMSQKAFAKKINASESTISNWITGKSMPDMDAISCICRVFHIKLRELLSDGEYVLSQDEMKLLIAYRKTPSMRNAVRKLLDIVDLDEPMDEMQHELMSTKKE